MSAAGGEMARTASLATPRFEGLPLRSLQWIAQLRRMWEWLRQRPALKPRSRRLQVQETVQLGEKRFVSILRVDGEQFLIGGSASGVTVLAALQPVVETQTFAAVLAGEERQACA